jgi:NhaP-type Na+/H+ or K+/H+ antiporter
MTFSSNPAIVVALALSVGIVCQSLARHLRLPGIVLLLGAGVLLGPDGLGVLNPDALGHALDILVGFAVAVILFEGGLNLQWRRLRREAVTIRRLISLGALITAAGGALAARWILAWDWHLSILFGTLVIVTGPTVITPLLRRIKVKRKLETVLEAEGVFIDAVGAIIAVVALELVLRSASGSTLAMGFISIPSRLLFGTLFGIAGGAVIGILLRFNKFVPEGFENVFTLALVLLLYQMSNFIMPETGIASAVAAGLVVGNIRTRVQNDLKEFKEQLTVLLIGMLFVLLAADVHRSEAMELGKPGLLVALVLMFVVRPINVLACTSHAGMTWREKAFLCWLAPRGIVAAAVATLFDERLTDAGITGGQDMRALVFLVIAVTVLFQGATGGLIARRLGVRRPSGQGYAILGAHPLSQVLGRLLQDAGEKVVLIDSDSGCSQKAEDAGFRVVFGNALEERVQIRAGIESRKAAIGLLPNGAVNLLFAKQARELNVPKAYIAIQRGLGGLNADMVHEMGGKVLFGYEVDLELWSVRIRRELTMLETWRFEREEITDGKNGTGNEGNVVNIPKDMQNTLLPLGVSGDREIKLIDSDTRIRAGDDVHWLVYKERDEKARSWLEENGWRIVDTSVEGKNELD